MFTKKTRCRISTGILRQLAARSQLQHHAACFVTVSVRFSRTSTRKQSDTCSIRFRHRSCALTVSGQHTFNNWATIRRLGCVSALNSGTTSWHETLRRCRGAVTPPCPHTLLPGPQRSHGRHVHHARPAWHKQTLFYDMVLCIHVGDIVLRYGSLHGINRHCSVIWFSAWHKQTLFCDMGLCIHVHMDAWRRDARLASACPVTRCPRQRTAASSGGKNGPVLATRVSLRGKA